MAGIEDSSQSELRSEADIIEGYATDVKDLLSVVTFLRSTQVIA